MSVVIFRSDMALVQCTCSLVSMDLEPWEQFEGGEQIAQGLKIWPGGMKPMLNIGNPPERNQIKVMRLWSSKSLTWKKQLDGIVGLPNTMTVSIQELEAAETLAGEKETYAGGTLEGVERAKYKAGPSEAVYLTLTIGPNGPVQ